MDQCFNTPLFQECVAGVFPIECVYAVVEVKSKLDSKQLGRSRNAIKTIRQLSKEKCYIGHPIGTKEGPEGATPYYEPVTFKRTLAPRSFIVAVDGNRSSSLIKSAKKCFGPGDGAFLHGCLVIKKRYFFRQLIEGRGARANFSEPIQGKECLAAFIQALLNAVLPFPMYPADMSRYLGIKGSDEENDP